MARIDAILVFWIQSHWAIALTMAFAVHLTIYFVGAGVGVLLTEHVWPAARLGRVIDQHPPKPGQVRTEIRNGVVTCLILAVATLSYRSLVAPDLWPTSWLSALLQIAGFTVFNNVYSYTTHRALHSRHLIRFHGVHHRSVRVTPWSGYSVHPLEATVIAATMPIFMLFFPIGLGTAFLLHAVGMTYTTCIHCNYELFPDAPSTSRLKRQFGDPAFHRLHHTRGRVNYGFTSRLLDELMGTAAE